MPAFLPVLMFAVLFGLSMDYEVFLVSRMRESWLRTNRHAARAVVGRLAGTGRGITAAAATELQSTPQINDGHPSLAFFSSIC